MSDNVKGDLWIKLKNGHASIYFTDPKKMGLPGNFIHVIEYSAYSDVVKAHDLNIDVLKEFQKLFKEAEVKIERLEVRILELREALEFYSGKWGPHQGSPIRAVNTFAQNRLNETCQTAIEALAADDRAKEEGKG